MHILAEFIAHHAETAKEVRKLEAAADMAISCTKVGDQGPNSVEKNRLKNHLKNRLKTHLRFPTPRKSKKMGSLDMSQNQN